MDNAEIINAVAEGRAVVCPVCNTANDADSNFCIVCGSSLKNNKSDNAPAFMPTAEPVAEPAAPAFAPVAEEPAAPAFAPVAEEPAAPAFVPVAEKSVPDVTEPVKQVPAEPLSAFAEGLPAWDIVPPQVVVRRH